MVHGKSLLEANWKCEWWETYANRGNGHLHWSMFESERGLITLKEPQSVHNFDLYVTDGRNERKRVVQPSDFPPALPFTDCVCSAGCVAR